MINLLDFIHVHLLRAVVLIDQPLHDPVRVSLEAIGSGGQQFFESGSELVLSLYVGHMTQVDDGLLEGVGTHVVCTVLGDRGSQMGRVVPEVVSSVVKVEVLDFHLAQFQSSLLLVSWHIGSHVRFL